MLQQMRPPFLRSSAHPGGPNSPLSNPIIPGIGPPPPPRNIGSASSPMHRSLISPHVHPSSNPNPGMIPPHPGLPIPGLPPFPPVNMLPNGRIPLPPVMNFGMPSLPLVPPPTLLVPYPIVVPLPVPIPIPIPIPFSPKDSRGEGQDKEKAANGELERDALKENNCSVREWEQGKRGAVQDGTAEALEDKKEHDSNLEEGEHAYALPLLSAGGCMVIQPLSKPGSDKAAILSCSISNPITSAGSPELEPPLKRRCLRIRNQNK
uniref:Uncharacterized protein n=1 Tax=Tetraodon nigroviridis TaxID=99883 RepID=H3CU33_TETNG